MLLLKEAEVSVVCLVIVAFIAIRYFSRVNRKKEGAAGGVFMLIIAFSIMHLAADGIIRIVLGDPTVISSSDMDRITLIYYSLYVVGMIGTLQSCVIGILVNAGVKKKILGWALFNVPAAILAGISIAMVDRIGVPLIRYSSIFYAIILFVFTAWFYERMESDLRRGLIFQIVFCVAFFVVYFILNLVIVPPATSMIMLSVCFSTLLIRESEVKVDPEAAKAEKKARRQKRALEDDRVSLKKDPLTGTDLEHAKKVRDMKDELSLGVTALLDREGIQAVLDEEGFEDDINDAPSDESVDDVNDDSEIIDEEISDIDEKIESLFDIETEEEGTASEGSAADDEASGTDEETDDDDESDVFFEEFDIDEDDEYEPVAEEAASEDKATEILEPEPAKVEQLVVPETDKPETKHNMGAAIKEIKEEQKEEQSKPDLTTVIKPLILDKDLKEKYRTIKSYIDNKQYNKVKDAIAELDEYRMSGIQLMRFGKISRLTRNEEWDSLAAELDK